MIQVQGQGSIFKSHVLGSCMDKNPRAVLSGSDPWQHSALCGGTSTFPVDKSRSRRGSSKRASITIHDVVKLIHTCFEMAMILMFWLNGKFACDTCAHPDVEDNPVVMILMVQS